MLPIGWLILPIGWLLLPIGWLMLLRGWLMVPVPPHMVEMVYSTAYGKG